MLQVKDPAIKLFGKTIPFCSVSVPDCVDEFGSCGGGSRSDNDRVSSDGSVIGVKETEKGEDESVNGSTVSETKDEKSPVADEEIMNGNSGSSNLTEEPNSKERPPLKKPDKVLPCPRCNSMDTKFCYYNNYNVLQPRHFCKGCQRYWTAGGAMRNVPVGAGRRKSKNASFPNRYLTISEVLQASGAGSSNGLVSCPPGLRCSSAAVSGSAGSLSNVAQMPFLDPARNLIHKVDEGVVTKSRRLGDINSSGSCITASIETESTQNGNISLPPSLNNSLAQMPCISAWPYPWNAAIPPPGFGFPFVPPTYWPCMAIPNTWNAPWIASQSLSQASTNTKPPELGKRSRNDEMLPKNKSERQETSKQPTVLTPKTLRIDHPEEAAKSSIWETLGIKNETTSKGGLFSHLKFKEADKIKYVPESYAHLTSNPAALSRSLNFQEVS